MSPGIAFFLGIWAATTYELKGWPGFFRKFFLKSYPYKNIEIFSCNTT